MARPEGVRFHGGGRVPAQLEFRAGESQNLLYGRSWPVGFTQ